MLFFGQSSQDFYFIFAKFVLNLWYRRFLFKLWMIYLNQTQVSQP